MLTCVINTTTDVYYIQRGLTLQVFFPEDQFLVLSLELLLPDIELTLRLLRLIEGTFQAVLLAAKGRNYLTLLPILALCGRIKAQCYQKFSIFLCFTWYKIQ